MAKYEEEKVVRQLNLKQDLRVDAFNGVIQMLKEPQARCDCGIKSKGKIDFLVNHKKFQFQWVSKFTI